MPIDPNRPWGRPSAAAPSVLPARLRRGQGGSQAKSAAAKTIAAKPAKATAKPKKSAAAAKPKKTAAVAAGT